jgi:uncharacterized protein YndB with AHSA1/START domain
MPGSSLAGGCGPGSWTRWSDISTSSETEIPMAAHHHRPDAGGVLEEGDGGLTVLRFTRRLAHPVNRVWAALTREAELIQWWGEAAADLTEGGEFMLRWLNTDDQGNGAVMHATITALDPPRLLELTGDLHGVLRRELRPEPGGTLLTFSSTLELPLAYRTKGLAGWHWHLDALGGKPADLAGITGWDQIHELYVEPPARTSPFS